MKYLRDNITTLTETMDAKTSQRFYKQANYALAKKYSPSLKQFIQYLPAIINQLRRHLNQQELSATFHDVHDYVVGYIHLDKDHLSLDDYGFWGYLDDAYLAGLLLQKVDSLALVQTTIERAQLSDWLQKTREVIPTEAKLLDELFIGLLTGNDTPYQQVFMAS